MIKLRLVSLIIAACLCGAAELDAQSLQDRPGTFRDLRPTAPSAYVSGGLDATFANHPQNPGLGSVWVGLVVGAGSGATLGALWGKHVDRQQVCPATGPCGGGSNAGPYALTGARQELFSVQPLDGLLEAGRSFMTVVKYKECI